MSTCALVLDAQTPRLEGEAWLDLRSFSPADDVFNASPRLLKGHNAINRKFGFASVLLDAS